MSQRKFLKRKILVIISLLVIAAGVYVYFYKIQNLPSQESVVIPIGKVTPPSSVSQSVPKLAQPGEHCGGFIRNAKKCVSGYHCQLNHIPDTGGICVAN